MPQPHPNPRKKFGNGSLLAGRWPEACANHGRTRAFTLIEIMIVVAVLGILAALIAPQMGNAATHQLPAAARLLAGDLAHAQLQSIQRVGDGLTGIKLLDNGTGYRIGRTDDNLATGIDDPIAHVPMDVVFGQGRAGSLPDVTITAHNFNGETDLVFDRFGALTQAGTDPATITLAADGLSITLTIDPTNGRVTIGTMQ